MSEPELFCWHDHIQLVYGVSRAAVYDFHTGAVYSLNSAAAQIIHLIDRKITLSQMNERQRNFVSQLEALQLGELARLPSPSKDESMPASERHPLTFLWLELNGNCNLGCRHCYAESQNPVIFPEAAKSPATGEPMRTANWRRVLREAADVGCRRVQFIGGEVLLYRDLLKLIDAAQEDGYTFIEVYTNGTLLTEAKVKALAARNVCLAVSLHGTEAAVHDNVTGLPGSFNRTVTALKWLRQYGISFRIAGTAMKSNQHDIIHLDEIATKLGANEVSFDVVRSVGSGENPELMPDDDQVLAQKWLTWPNFVADRATYEHNRRWNPCWAGKLAITSTGEVMPCVMGRSQVVGNVCAESLTTILEEPRLQYLWGITKDQVAVCRECEYRYLCGDCRPLASSGGDLHGAIPRCTYNPQDGTWRWPGTEARQPGPAPEDLDPCIAPNMRRLGSYFLQGSKKLSEKNVHFRCDPDARELDDKIRRRPNGFQREPDNFNDGTYLVLTSDVSLSPNHHFQCDPDR